MTETDNYAGLAEEGRLVAATLRQVESEFDQVMAEYLEVRSDAIDRLVKECDALKLHGAQEGERMRQQSAENERLRGLLSWAERALRNRDINPCMLLVDIKRALGESE